MKWLLVLHLMLPLQLLLLLLLPSMLSTTKLGGKRPALSLPQLTRSLGR